MPHRLVLKVTKFQLPPLKSLGTVVKNIFGGHHAPPPPMSNRVKQHFAVYLCKTGSNAFCVAILIENDVEVTSKYSKYISNPWILIIF